MRILVVTGSRVWEADRRSARWARRVVLGFLVEGLPDAADAVGPVDLVVHGRAPGPDTYADEGAAALLIPRVAFPAGDQLAKVFDRPDHRKAESRMVRLAKHAERYRYPSGQPLRRNDAMLRWAKDRAVEGHEVWVKGLIAPWAKPGGGTRYTLGRARELELRVVEVSGDAVPADAWPLEHEAAGRQGAGRGR